MVRGLNVDITCFNTDSSEHVLSIEMVRGLNVDITCFNTDIATEGLHHCKVVNWVGIPMGWERSANYQRIQIGCYGL